MSSTRRQPDLAGSVSAFAGILLMVVGVAQGFVGLTAWASNGSPVYAATKHSSYFLHLNTNSWGGLHVVLGVLIFCAGVGISYGALWARVAGIVVVAVSAIANFAFIPIYPFWAILLVALDVLIIWALTTHSGKPLR